MSKINWSQAQADYIADETLSYKDIAQKYGVATQNVAIRAGKDHWVEKRKELISTSGQRVIERTSEAITEVTMRHIQTAKILQAKGMEALVTKDMNPENFSEAVKSVKDGVDIERKAYGLDKPQQNVHININPIIEENREKYGF